MKEKFVCSRCKKNFEGYPAISRRDNKTKICSDCGQEEAIFDFMISREVQLEKSWLREVKDKDDKTR